MIISISQQSVEMVVSLISKFQKENELIGKENLDLKERIKILEQEVQSRKDFKQKYQMDIQETTSLQSSNKSLSERIISTDQNSGTKITKKVVKQKVQSGQQIQCPNCPKKYLNIRGLKIHQRKIHFKKRKGLNEQDKIVQHEKVSIQYSPTDGLSQEYNMNFAESSY